MYRHLLLSFLVLFSFASLFGQKKLLSPDEFLPHNIGEHFTYHYQLVDYMEHVAANSDGVQITQYGMTNEDRPLLLLYASTAENLQRLEDIRQGHLQNAGMAGASKTSEDNIAIVWLSFSVHGNEAAGSESSMPIIYELANPNNATVQEMLKNTIVIFDPCINPDGYSRYTNWYKMAANRLSNPHIPSREHQEPWPGGRVNHYYFDLNRDWAWATQVESQQRLKIYNQWLPHIHVDFHEQGHNSPYYFAPAAEPYHAYITKWQRDFQIDIGKNHAKYFDEEGWVYFTKEVFDLLYPSYGDTYPTFNGGIGMTYEQGGSRIAGRAVITETGDTLTLKDRVEHHITTALSSIEISSKNAQKLNQNFRQFFTEIPKNPVGEYRSFIIKGTNSTSKLKKLTQLLDRHDIQYGRIKDSQQVLGFDYSTGKTSTVYVSSNDLIISAYQPKSILVQVLFEPEPRLVDSMTYDITAWALPYAHGLHAFASSQRIDVAEDYTFAEYQPGFDAQKTAYAYVARWESLQNATFLSALLNEDIKVRYATNGFSFNGKSYKSGTLVMLRADNRKMGERFDKVVQKIAVEHEQEMDAVTSGFMSSGSDFGSSAYQFIEKPKVAAIGGEGVSPYNFGQLWHYFETDLKYPITVIAPDQLARTNLYDYNVLIAPAGRYRWSEDFLNKLSDWVSAGGRIIAMESAISALEGKKGFRFSKYATDDAKNAAKKANDEKTLEKRTQAYNQRNRSFLTDFIPGAIFKVKMDYTHPLAYGFSNYYFSLKTNSTNYDLQKNIWNVGYIPEDVMVLGFAGSAVQKRLTNAVNFAVEDKGRGSVVYLVDNPLYRGFWEQGKFLFSNAVFFR